MSKLSYDASGLDARIRARLDADDRTGEEDRRVEIARRFGQDTYAKGTVIRFEKRFVSRPEPYTYAAVKANDRDWYITGTIGSGPLRWSGLLAFIVGGPEPTTEFMVMTESRRVGTDAIRSMVDMVGERARFQALREHLETPSRFGGHGNLVTRSLAEAERWHHREHQTMAARETEQHTHAPGLAPHRDRAHKGNVRTPCALQPCDACIEDGLVPHEVTYDDRA